MGRVGLLALAATERCLADAGLDRGAARGRARGARLRLHARVVGGDGGVHPRPVLDLQPRGAAGDGVPEVHEPHCAANLAQHYGIRGRVVPTCAACVSGSLAIGTGYELLRAGTQDAVLCGGAEELHFVHAAVFDMLYATSRRYNDRPDESPRPFDAARDGLVIGEGAGTLLLERHEHARRAARGCTRR